MRGTDRDRTAQGAPGNDLVHRLQSVAGRARKRSLARLAFIIVWRAGTPAPLAYSIITLESLAIREDKKSCYPGGWLWHPDAAGVQGGAQRAAARGRYSRHPTR